MASCYDLILFERKTVQWNDNLILNLSYDRLLLVSLNWVMFDTENIEDSERKSVVVLRF